MDILNENLFRTRYSILNSYDDIAIVKLFKRRNGVNKSDRY